MNRVVLSAFYCFATAVLVLSAGCAEPKVVPSSGPRPPLDASKVMIYEKKPLTYEILGTVTVSAAEGAKWDERGDANAAFDKLKSKSAAMGANGVLLVVDDAERDRFATAGYHGKFYQVPLKGKPPTAVAKAIYVLEK
jgi:hypothetical protein